MLIISDAIRTKLIIKHNVSKEEVEQCIANLDDSDKLFEDTREEHKTNPPSLWFISQTDFGRKLKIVVVLKDGHIYLKTAYQANSTEINLYASLNNR